MISPRSTRNLNSNNLFPFFCAKPTHLDAVLLPGLLPELAEGEGGADHGEEAAEAGVLAEVVGVLAEQAKGAEPAEDA